MKIAFIRKKNILARGIMTAVAIFVLAGALTLGTFSSRAEDERLKEARSCSFVIPPEFVPSTQPGLFINKNHPMESSTIQYSYYDNGNDLKMTNREKEAASQSPLKPLDEPELLSKEVYQETLAAAYNSEYGQDVGFNVSSFDKISVDGYPGFKIVSSFKVGDEETVHQTVYMLISRYRVFTVTYQRAEDDDCEDTFLTSAATIHLCN
jgi:hypothetical protein